MGSFWRTVDRDTLRGIALICLADAVVGVSFGAIVVSGGLSSSLAVAMSLLIFAGGAQFAAAAVLLSGGGPAAAILAGLLINTRLLPYGFAVTDILDGPWWTRLAGAHILVDESVAAALRQQDRASRKAAFWICGATLFAVWNLAVAAGAAAGRHVGDTGAIGLDAVFPAVLLALVLPVLTDRGTRRAAALAAVVTVVTDPVLPAGLPVLLGLAGLVAVGRPGRASGRPGGCGGCDSPGSGGSGTSGQPDQRDLSPGAS